jgi:hypothetical protein
MHATICRYEPVGGPIDEVMRAGRELTWVLGQSPGFIAYVVLDTGDGALTSVSVFETRAELDGADRLVAGWVADHLAAALPNPPRVTIGEVIIQRGM